MFERLRNLGFLIFVRALRNGLDEIRLVVGFFLFLVDFALSSALLLHIFLSFMVRFRLITSLLRIVHEKEVREEGVQKCRKSDHFMWLLETVDMTDQ